MPMDPLKLRQASVFQNATYSASTQALAVKSENSHELMQTPPYLSIGLMQLMTGYIQDVQERYRELATENM